MTCGYAVRRKITVVRFLLAGAMAFAAATSGAQSRLERLGHKSLCVTEGAVEDLPGQKLGVSVPKMRAYLNAKTAQAVEVRFRYLGSTGHEARLGSGELRRQFGLKLRAQDACNLVYAMWRIEPESKLVVSVKENPGEHTSAECGNRGYRNIKPAHSSPVPVPQPGDTHVLRAEMRGEELRVFADNRMVWDGRIGADALAFDGPVGMRSDNAKLEIEFFAALPSGIHAANAPPCRSGPSEAE